MQALRRRAVLPSFCDAPQRRVRANLPERMSRGKCQKPVLVHFFPDNSSSLMPRELIRVLRSDASATRSSGPDDETPRTVFERRAPVAAAIGRTEGARREFTEGPGGACQIPRHESVRLPTPDADREVPLRSKKLCTEF